MASNTFDMSFNDTPPQASTSQASTSQASTSQASTSLVDKDTFQQAPKSKQPSGPFSINLKNNDTNQPRNDSLLTKDEEQQLALDEEKTKDDEYDSAEQSIKGIILFEHEPETITFAKWVGWIIVMVLIVMVFIWFGFYFNKYECDLDRKDLKSNKKWDIVYDTYYN
jgi:hypothetical protein